MSTIPNTPVQAVDWLLRELHAVQFELRADIRSRRESTLRYASKSSSLHAQAVHVMQASARLSAIIALIEDRAPDPSLAKQEAA